MSIAILICIWQRPENLVQIIDALNYQTEEDFSLYVWNNNHYKWARDIVEKAKNAALFSVKIVHADCNYGSRARFWLASHVKENIAITMDDDQLPKQDFVEYMRARHEEFGGLCGWKARNFTKDGGYWNSEGVSYGEEAHYLGTGGLIMPLYPLLDYDVQNVPLPYQQVEDFWLSYIAYKKYGLRKTKIRRRLHKLKDNKDQHKIFGLRKVKEQALADLRVRGWP